VKLPAVLFDLDMTLLDTSALMEARAQQDWNFVTNHLHLARPFSVNPEPAPHKVPALLRQLGHKVAVVTSSPRWYAEALLARFEVSYDVLVAAGDYTRYKPDPEPLQKALAHLGVAPADAYYVGDAEEDFEASFHAGIRSIGAGWNPAVADLWKTAPDVFLYHPGFLLRPDLLPQLGYVAEVLAEGRTPLIHPGSFLRCGTPARVSLGRYFPSKDARYATHALTHRVLELKNDDAPSALFGAALANYVKVMQPQPFYATGVPPKPSQPRIRFAATLQAMKGAVPEVSVVLDGLYATREVEDYKLANYENRAELIAGAFASKYPSWASQSVLLVDDVLTSGATTDECARVLAAHQAGSVHTVCLAADQNATARLCPRSLCSGRLKIRFRGYDSCPFWGCSEWRRDGSGCVYTEDFVE
jgi:HAD superfamily hydrolase (TIGR01509 family)